VNRLATNDENWGNVDVEAKTSKDATDDICVRAVGDGDKRWAVSVAVASHETISDSVRSRRRRVPKNDVVGVCTSDFIEPLLVTSRSGLS
jgi:hypothetical protein